MKELMLQIFEKYENSGTCCIENIDFEEVADLILEKLIIELDSYENDIADDIRLGRFHLAEYNNVAKKIINTIKDKIKESK
jgi:hypothetical protein